MSATLTPLNYSVTRADQLDQSGTITSQIIDGLLNSDLVIADLTDHNANVFYELAIRHAVAKPFIQLIAEGQSLPFDIQGLRTVFVDHRDLDSVDNAKKSLAGMVDSIRNGNPVETPLTYTMNIQSLRQSDDFEARGIAEIIEEMQEVKRSFRQFAEAPSVRGSRRTPEARDLVFLLDFIEHLASVDRVKPDDLREIVGHRDVSKKLSEWASRQIAKNWPNVPPF
ncbi:hypothetical protein [Saccharopolyspora cebuensis]|uniref:Uncharacterized protein n=1 Tax=Saccharopolyspora cebuensis TaxID=418759 RepID=A0ABV4CER7_9PSEU